MARIICVAGTRPEVIKMAPVISALTAAGHDAPLLVTAQHRHLLDQMLGVFQLTPRWDLDIMQADQGLAALTGRLVPALEIIFAKNRPDLVVAQGDTSTVFCAALSAYYSGIPFAHVEAGLRSGDLASPFPEEGHRCLTAQLTALHFAPTVLARKQLLDEGLKENTIHVVGNTVIDALLAVAARTDLPRPGGLGKGPFALITLHRRENFGAPLRQILASLRQLALAHPELTLVYPVHPNPHVLGPARECLGDLANVRLREPMDYLDLVAHLKLCHAVYTDSGGLQEEAPALGKPVLVFRETTERPEAVAAGGVRLVGCDPARFLKEAEALLQDPGHYEAMARPRFPYGDGSAAGRIQGIISRALDARRRP